MRTQTGQQIVMLLRADRVRVRYPELPAQVDYGRKIAALRKYVAHEGNYEEQLAAAVADLEAQVAHGETLAAMPGLGSGMKTDTLSVLLGAEGMSRAKLQQLSSRWQTMARVPPGEREAYYDDCRENLMLPAQAWLLERGKEIARKERLAAAEESRVAAAQVVPQRAQLWVGDCLEWLPKQPDCDLLLTDPPYMTDVPDIYAFAEAWLPLALAKVKPTGRAYIFIGAYSDEEHAYLTVQKPTQLLGWTYRNVIGPMPSHGYKINSQTILYYQMPDAPPLNGDLLTERFTVHDINAPDGRLGDRYHTWQKPMKLAERLIRQATQPGDLVLDPFACTGTFPLAAATLGRRARGCEIEPEHAAIAERRGCVLL